MDDRELLELAAKAAGIKHNQWDYEAMRQLGHIISQGMMWNPLVDDGDALRLATGLQLDVIQGAAHAACDSCLEVINGDRLSATRRVIVRAAAEIGRSIRDAPQDPAG